MKFLVVLLLIALNLGCQTNELKAYERLQVGMEKGEVLTIMGSPRRSDRHLGNDRWTYVFFANDQKYEKEIQFSEGKAVYVGDLIKPQVSAEEQDQQNTAANKELEAASQAKKELQKNSFTHYEEETKGAAQPRHVPTFTPVD